MSEENEVKMSLTKTIIFCLCFTVWVSCSAMVFAALLLIVTKEFPITLLLCALGFLAFTVCKLIDPTKQKETK